MVKSLVFYFCILFASTACIQAQESNPDSMVHRSIKAASTDAQIDWALRNHHTYFNPTAKSKNKLLLHMVGTYDNPASTTFYPTLAANYGIHAISLMYPNGLSATTACRGSADPTCFNKFRHEMLFGEDSSSSIDIDEPNSILNRVQKLLLYLHQNHPAEGWNSFLLSNNEIDWSKVLVSGHSQGGGHAAYIGKQFKTDRVIMFASPNDFSGFYARPALWFQQSNATADSNHYAFGNKNDEISSFKEQVQIWNEMDLSEFGDTVNVAYLSCPYNSARMLYTSDTSSANKIAGNHSNMIIDSFTPLNGNIPIFEPVWKYLLDICDNNNSISTTQQNQFSSIYPNPAQSIFQVKTKVNANKVSIFNANGALIMEYIPKGLSFQLQINTKGLYVLSIETENKILSKLVLIQ